MDIELVVLNIDAVLSARGVIDTDISAARGFVAAFERRLNELYAAAAARPEVKDCASASALLRARGVRVVLASALSTQAVEAVLDAAEIEPTVFDAVIASNETRHARRNIVRAVIEETGASSALTAVVACGPIDLYEALAAGCTAIVGVASSRYAAWELSRHPHTAVTQSLHEAAELFAPVQSSFWRLPWRSCNEHGNPG